MSSHIHADLYWQDRKRHYGLPLSFEVYAISDDRLFLTSGLLQRIYKEILLYRIRDISLSRTLGQRLFGVGTVIVRTSDNEIFTLENVCAPHQVKELLHQNVEDQKRARGFRFGEFYGSDPEFCQWSPRWA